MIRRFTLSFLLSTGILHNLPAQTDPNHFYQKVQTNIPLPPEADKNIIRLFHSTGNIIAVSNNGVFRYSNGKWSGKAAHDHWLLAAIDAQNNLWLASQKNIQSATGKIIPIPNEALRDTLQCLYPENDHTLHLGTSNGLYTWNGSWTQQPPLKGISVNDVIADARQCLWAATHNGLWRREKGEWINLDETLMAEGNLRTYFTLATHNNGADLIFSSPLSVGCIAANGDHWVWSSANGLPYAR